MMFLEPSFEIKAVKESNFTKKVKLKNRKNGDNPIKEV